MFWLLDGFLLAKTESSLLYVGILLQHQKSHGSNLAKLVQSQLCICHLT